MWYSVLEMLKIRSLDRSMQFYEYRGLGYLWWNVKAKDVVV